MSDLNNIFAEKIGLAVKNQVKSLSRKIRDLLPCIEHALVEGYKHKEIVSYLNEQGLAVTWNTYDKAVARARIKTSTETIRTQNQREPVMSLPGKLPVSKPPVLPPPREVNPSYNPQKLIEY